MQAVILAGGMGTRLGNITKDIPKPMLNVAGKPLLHYLISNLTIGEINDIIILTGHMSDVIEEYITSFHPGLNIKCLKEDAPKGTAGALFNVWEYLDDTFIMVNGDTFFDADLKLLYEFPHSAVIGLKYMENSSRYGTVNLGEDYKILSFKEKSLESDCFISSGVYKFKKGSLEKYYKQWEGDKLSFEEDVFPKMVLDNCLYGLPLGGCFVDIGVTDDYRLANSLIPQRLLQNRKSALFIDRDNTLIEDTGYVHGDDFSLLNKADTYIKQANQKGWHVIVVSNQAGIAKGYFTIPDVELTNSKIKLEYLKKGLIIDDFYYCPFHPEGVIKEFARPSLSRKPNPGMILSACERYNIDIKNSVMIGDNAEVDTIKLPYLKSEII